MPISKKSAAKLAKEKVAPSAEEIMTTKTQPKPVKVSMQESIPLPSAEVLSVSTAETLVSALANSLKLAKALRKLVKTEAAKIRKMERREVFGSRHPSRA